VAKTIELTVPDLGGFSDVEIIEVLISSGDAIGKDAPLVMLESDKATMEVPASAGGIIRDVRVKIGDRVSPGSVLANVEVSDDDAPLAAPAIAPPAQPAGDAAPPISSAAAGALTEITELVVPDLGGFDSVPVISVFVQPGDVIAKDAPLVELESDKATMEVPAVVGGVVRDVLVRVGDKVGPGTIIATVGGAASPAARPEPKRAQPPAPALAAIVAPAPPSQNGKSAGSAEGPFHASPAIRRFARELGVPIRAVTGSGPNGRVTRDDVQSFVKHALSGAIAIPAPPPATSGGGGLQFLPWPKIDFEKFGPIERVPLSRIAKLSGQNLARNWVMIPHVTQHEDADVTDLESFRKGINAEQKDVKVTMLALLMKALVAALRQYPKFNSSLDGDDLILKRGFTISSLGGIGGTAFTPIINAPEVAILGVSRTLTKPVWDGGGFQPRLILPLSLSYDHRVIDGAAAARFCVFLASVLADMRKTLL
jgi:pyruvate dehydrogenase E2 component (dihydrolipoamide acetyltransferase)